VKKQRETNARICRALSRHSERMCGERERGREAERGLGVLN